MNKNFSNWSLEFILIINFTLNLKSYIYNNFLPGLMISHCKILSIPLYLDFLLDLLCFGKMFLCSILQQTCNCFHTSKRINFYVCTNVSIFGQMAGFFACLSTCTDIYFAPRQNFVPICALFTPNHACECWWSASEIEYVRVYTVV